MKSSSYSKAKTLTRIPIIVLAVTAICVVLAAVLRDSTNKGTLYSVFAFAGIISAFISPFLCLVISVVGTAFAAKARKEGTTGARKTFTLGIFEILVCAVGTVLAIIMFIAGKGV
ncbi:MAG: hypothetical protein E7474_05170 [Ruminococcaceae bacterium]|nr:hypothetical protein [Oscillospiraceae bacterium]